MLRALVLVLLGIALVVPATASADDVPDNRIVVTGRLDVARGEVVDTAVIIDGPATVAGRVRDDLIAISGPIRVTGRVEGDVIAATDRITLGPTAVVTGDVRYGDERPVIASRARVGGDVTKEDWWSDAPWSFIGVLAWWLMVTVSTLILGVILTAAFPQVFEAARAAWSRGRGSVVAAGIVAVIALPIVGVLAAVTIVALPLGIAILLALAPLAAVAYVAGCVLLGRRIVPATTSTPLAFLAGFGILRLIALIPAVGWLGWLVASLLGAGALIMAALRLRRPEGAPPPAAPAGV